MTAGSTETETSNTFPGNRRLLETRCGGAREELCSPSGEGVSGIAARL